MERAVRLPSALLCLCWGLCCGRSDEAADRSRVLHALDALRDAPGDALAARRTLLADLEATAAAAPSAVRARDACAAAYRLLIDGTELQRGIQAELEGDSGAAASLVPRLLEAEAKIRQSGARMADCEQASAELRLGRR